MKKRGSKAQGLSLNTIIIAALGLLVLVVLVLIFTGKIDILQKSTTCDARNGVCLAIQGDKTKCPDVKPISIMTDDCRFVKAGNPTSDYPGQCCISLR